VTIYRILNTLLAFYLPITVPKGHRCGHSLHLLHCETGLASRRNNGQARNIRHWV